MKSYVYLVTFMPTNQMYIGSRKNKNPSDDLFKNYFTSSKIVKNLLKEHTASAFLYKIIKEFDSYDLALSYERQLHLEYNVVDNPAFLNQAIAGVQFRTKGPRSDETKQKIRNALQGRPNPRKGFKGRPCSVETKLKLSAANKRNPNLHKDVWAKTLSKEPDVTWYNKHTGEYFTGNRRALKVHDTRLYVPELGWVISGKSKSHKGWTISS